MSEAIITNPICVEQGDTLETVNKLINGEGLSHLPVVENGKLVGVVDMADLSSRYLKIMEQNESCEQCVAEINVHQIMNTSPVTVLESDSLDLIMEVFLSNDVKGLIVVDNANNLKGLITSFDLLEYILAA